MSLVNCHEGTNQVSDQAFKCPSCGKQIRKPKRTFMGKVFKWLFILFNWFMVYSLFTGLGGGAEVINSATTDAEKAGAAIGAGLGLSMILGLWVIGDIIIGLFVLFTRPKA